VVGPEIPFQCSYTVENIRSDKQIEEIKITIYLKNLKYNNGSYIPKTARVEEVFPIITWYVGTLPPGGKSTTFTITVSAISLDPWSANYTFDYKGKGGGELAGTVAGFGLSATLDTDKKPVSIDEEFYYTLVLKKKGGFPVQTVTADIELPNNFVFISAETSPPGYNAKIEGNWLKFGPIASIDQEFKISFVVKATVKGDFVTVAYLKHAGFDKTVPVGDGIKVH